MANIISCIRIVCGIALTFCSPFTKTFYALYILGGISDVLDGFIARRLNIESELGSKLDTVADIVFVSVVLIKVIGAVYIPIWIIVWVICIAIIKCVSIIKGMVKNHTLVSEHTVLNKVTGVLLFAIPLCIKSFPWQPVFILVILTCIAATIAAVQEWYYSLSRKTK